MRITVNRLQLTATGNPGACAGDLHITIWQPGAAAPCISHPVSLGPLSGGATIPLGFDLDSRRCGGDWFRIAAEVAVRCRRAWWQRLLGRGTPGPQVVAEANMSVAPNQAAGEYEIPLLVPPGVSLITGDNAELDPVIDSDLPDVRLTLSGGDRNGSLHITLKA